MARCVDIDSHRHEHLDYQVDEWNVYISPWQGDPIEQRLPFNGYYNPHQAQVEYHHSDLRDLNGSPSDYQLLGDAVYHPEHLTSSGMRLPYYSSPSTLYDGSSSPSVGSPEQSLLRTPEVYHCNLPVPALGLHSYSYSPNYGVHANASSCVAMQNVQKCADVQPEECNDDYRSFDIYEPQELVPAASEDNGIPSPTSSYTPIPIAHIKPHDSPSPKPEPNQEPNPTPSPVIRNRRAHKQSPTTGRTKVQKRPSTRRPTSTPTKTPPRQTQEDPLLLRAFHCPLAPYGCTSSFSAKNEWKRHASTQHFRLGFWRCDQCTQGSSPNDFNRKDLFVQHVRRMHATTTITAAAPAPSTKKTSKNGRRANAAVANNNTTVVTVEAALNNAAERCYRRTRSAPQICCCVFCGEQFEGDGGLESRMEHVGKHMETRRKEGLQPVEAVEWREDREMEQWMVRHGAVVKRRGQLVVPT